MVEAGNKLGLEMEMMVVRQGTSASHPIQNYFQQLAQIKRDRGVSPTIKQISGLDTCVDTDAGESGLDNGLNLLETAFAPVQGGVGGLARLADRVKQELSDVVAALSQEGATVFNASEHPCCRIDAKWYAQVCVPRTIYKELVGYREWLHRVGIDSKAQNGPCTSVDVRQAARALNVTLGLAPALIALYANSPLEGGRVTGLKENRLTIWSRMFKHSRFSGDFLLQCLPERPFKDLGDYFRWMFGPGTVSRALSPGFTTDYKSAGGVFLHGDPSLSAFLMSSQWQGRSPGTNEVITLKPNVEHFVYSQFANFLDARWRYRLERFPSVDVLLQAWERPGGIEELFSDCGADGYIEGRAPGAVFADRQLVNEAGAELASTVTISPSALQLGLLRNIEQAEAVMQKWGWLRLRGMRAQAIKYALADDAVCALAQDVLHVAGQGLDGADQHWLDYPRYVLESRKTGADRLLELWCSSQGSATERLAALSEAHTIKLV